MRFNMKKLIISLLALLSFSYGDNTDTEQQISGYEDNAMYHQFITHEYELALGYHKKACELGSGMACSNAASLYYNGYKGQKSNKKKAFRYYKKSCNLDNGYACTATAMFYEQGLVAEKDEKQALHYYQKACKLHDEKACDILYLPVQ